jgi:hypothetical protein
MNLEIQNFSGGACPQSNAIKILPPPPHLDLGYATTGQNTLYRGEQTGQIFKVESARVNSDWGGCSLPYMHIV